MAKQLAVFFVSSQTCASDSQNSKKISNAHFNYTTCLTIIITETTMTNRLEELTVGLSSTILI